jgi:hypothetical protein
VQAGWYNGYLPPFCGVFVWDSGQYLRDEAVYGDSLRIIVANGNPLAESRDAVIEFILDSNGNMVRHEIQFQRNALRRTFGVRSMMADTFPGQSLSRFANAKASETQAVRDCLQRIKPVRGKICVIRLTCKSANGIGLPRYGYFRFWTDRSDDGFACHKIIEGNASSIRLKTPDAPDKTVGEDKFTSILAPVNASDKRGVVNEPISLRTLFFPCWNDS